MMLEDTWPWMKLHDLVNAKAINNGSNKGVMLVVKKVKGNTWRLEHGSYHRIEQ